MATSAGIVLVFGALHLLYTFSGPALQPRDPWVRTAMECAHPVLTRETTMWRAYVGFNATHSMALILFGLIFGYFALAQPRLLFDSAFLLALGFATLTAFVALARSYFFSVPLAGVSIALACYVASILIASA